MGNIASTGEDDLSLPAEVCCHVASFLDARDVPSMAQVNRTWNWLTEHDALWRGLYLRRFVYRLGDLPPPAPRLAAWPVVNRPGSDAFSEEDDDGHTHHMGRKNRQAKAQALMEANAAEREEGERRQEEEEMTRIRAQLQQDAPHPWKTCFQRRLRMKDGVCLVFLVGSNTLPYAADVVDKLRSYGVVVNSTCTIMQPYNGKGPHSGWKEELHDHMQRHSVVIFFANIAGGDEAVRGRIGDEMAEFVEAGGSVVLAAFATCNVGESPGGRWQKRNYFPIGLGGQTSVRVELDLTSEGSDHHLLHGVRRAFASYHGVGQVHAEAKVMGRWSDASPAMARLKAGRGTIVAVNYFPPSSDIGDGGWPAHGKGWMGKEDNSSARAWVYQFMEELNVDRQPATNEEALGDDVPEAVVAVADVIARVPMEMPPELTTLFSQVGQESARSGSDPWQELIQRIDSEEFERNPPKEATFLNDSHGGDESRLQDAQDEEELKNDVMVMLANAVKYGLWKASRLEPRKSAASSTPSYKMTKAERKAAAKSAKCLLC